MERKGVYALTCSCPGNPKYIGKTRVKIKNRMSQHREDVASLRKNPNMSVSGVTKHAAECQQGSVDWENPEVLTTYQDKHKGNLERNLLIRESLEIRRQDTVNTGLNERNDISSKFVKTTAWVPILKKLK